jgi:hypothetical protein
MFAGKVKNLPKCGTRERYFTRVGPRLEWPVRDKHSNLFVPFVIKIEKKFCECIPCFLLLCGTQAVANAINLSASLLIPRTNKLERLFLASLHCLVLYDRARQITSLEI